MQTINPPPYTTRLVFGIDLPKQSPAHNVELLLVWLPSLLHGRKLGVERLGVLFADMHGGTVSISPSTARKGALAQLAHEHRGRVYAPLRAHAMLFATHETVSHILFTLWMRMKYLHVEGLA